MRGLDWCGLVSGWELHGLHFLGVGPLRGVCAGGVAPVRGVSTAASALRGGRLADAWGWWPAVYHSIKFMRFP